MDLIEVVDKELLLIEEPTPTIIDILDDEKVVVQDEKIVLVSEGLQGPPGPLTGKVIRFEMLTPSLVWRCEHGMETNRIVAMLWDRDGNQFSAPIKQIDANAFEVRLTSALSGHVDAIFDTSGVPVVGAVGL